MNAESSGLKGLLTAHEEYRVALLRLYEALDISPVYAGDPRLLFAGLLVAGLVDGVALPPPSEYTAKRFATVFAASGARYQVLCVSDQDGVFGGGWVIHGDPTRFEHLAMVVFVAARPVAVHLMPVGRVDAVGAALGDPRLPGRGMCLTMGTHVNLMLEPATAAAYGVETVDLVGAEL